jgi:hypothetical protein
MYELPNISSESSNFGYLYPPDFGSDQDFIDTMKKLDLFTPENSKKLIREYEKPSGKSSPGKSYRAYLKNSILQNTKQDINLRKAVAKHLCTRVPEKYQYLLK